MHYPIDRIAHTTVFVTSVVIEQPTQIQWCMTYKTFFKTFNYLIPSSYCRNHTLKYYKSRILIFLLILWHTKHIFSKLYLDILWHTKPIFSRLYLYILWHTKHIFLWLYFYILWHTKHFFQGYIFIFYDTPNTFFQGYIFIFYDTPNTFCGYIFIFYDTPNTLFVVIFLYFMIHQTHFLWFYFYILWHTKKKIQDYTAKKKFFFFFKENLTITDVHWFYEKYVSITSGRLEGWLLGVCKTFVFVSCREWPLINIVCIRQPIPKLHKQQDENNPHFSESQNIKKTKHNK